MKKLPVYSTTFLYLLIFFISITTSCQKTRQESNGDSTKPAWMIIDPVEADWGVIKERGVLKAIVENSTTSYFLYKAQAMGYEYEMLNKLADALGVRLQIIVENNIDTAFEMLNNGEGDIIAFKLTVTKERRRWFAFSESLYQVQQVLVQRKPDNWREMRIHEIEKQLIRNPIDLIGKQVHVRKGSSYINRLTNLSEEVGGDILIIEGYPELDTEGFIKKVADGEIDYTVSDDDIAQVNASYYTNLDVNTVISFPQQIAWAMRKNADSLQMMVDQWVREEKKGSDIYVIYNRYFKSPKGSLVRARSEYSSISGSRISVYDEMIKAEAERIDWDWRLLAALIFQESRFEPEAESWAGAVGLMQLMPGTAVEFGAENPFDVRQSLFAGANYLSWLNRLWQDRIEDEEERKKFIMASYNVGPGHVEDAVRLADKYGYNAKRWEDNVEKYLELKSEPVYFNDKVVKHGYCRGYEPVNYVRNILYRYNQYQMFFPMESEEESS